MKGFNTFYLWGLDMKYRMSLYTLAAVFFKGIVNALMGVFTVDSLTMLQMLLASMAFACAETAIFPTGKEWEGMQKRTVLWVILADAVYLGCAFLFGWFRGVPVWGGVLLVVWLQFAIGAMWYALRLEARRDTKNLNRRLKDFQQEN